jgi:hypothetical protein
VEAMTGADIKDGWDFDIKEGYGGERKQQHGSNSVGNRVYAEIMR